MHRLRVLLPVTLLVGTLALAANPPENRPGRRPTDAERGEELYGRHCVQCHGPSVRGDGPATAAFVHPVPDLVGKIKVDEPTITAVHLGKGTMPSFEVTFDRADAKRVLQHMKKLSDGARKAKTKKSAPSEEADED